MKDLQTATADYEAAKQLKAEAANSPHDSEREIAADFFKETGKVYLKARREARAGNG